MKYRCEGGPLDGQLVEPPPSYLEQIASRVAEAIGGSPPTVVAYIDGWAYEFDTERADVLVGRPVRPEEETVLRVAVQPEKPAKVAVTMAAVEVLRIADQSFGPGDFAFAHRGDLGVLVCRGGVEELARLLGIAPEPIPDTIWNQPTTEEAPDGRSA